MTVGSPFDSRAQGHNVKRQWREWSGYFASSAYAAHHEIEVNAIRNAAAIIDVSPLFKYRVSGPDAQRLVDRVITRDASKLARGQVYYTPWCDEHGKVIDDGTVSRLDDDSYRWTAADAQVRWLRLNARGLDVIVEEISGAGRLPGAPGSPVAGRPGGRDRRVVRRPALLPAAREPYRRHRDRRQPHRLHRRPGLRAVDRRGTRIRAVGCAHGGRPRLRPATGGHAGPRRGAGRGGAHPAGGGLHLLDACPHPGAELLTGRDRPRSPGGPGQGDAVRGPGGAPSRGGGRWAAAASGRARRSTGSTWNGCTRRRT